MSRPAVVCLVRVVYEQVCHMCSVLCHLAMAMEVWQMTNQPSNREASHGSNREQEGQRGLFTWRWGENRDASHRPPASPNPAQTPNCPKRHRSPPAPAKPKPAAPAAQSQTNTPTGPWAASFPSSASAFFPAPVTHHSPSFRPSLLFFSPGLEQLGLSNRQFLTIASSSFFCEPCPRRPGAA